MQSVSSQIDRLPFNWKNIKGNLTKDIDLLDGLYDQNKRYFDDVTLYIAAAQRKSKIYNNISFLIYKES